MGATCPICYNGCNFHDTVKRFVCLDCGTEFTISDDKKPDIIIRGKIKRSPIIF